MSHQHRSFKSLSFSDLFTDYTNDFDTLKAFFNKNPFSDEELTSGMSDHRSGLLSQKYIEALASYHQYLGIADHQKPALEKLSTEGAKVVVTGQQLGMFGGPLFTIYKTVTAILQARKLEEVSGLPVVPVFWMGDEDHDYEEIEWVGIPAHDTYHQVCPETEGTGETVAEQPVPEDMASFVDQVFKKLPETDFTEELKNILMSCYVPGRTHAQAFAQLISTFFPDQGLLIAGSNHISIKKLTTGFFKQAVINNDTLNTLLQKKSREVAEPYHQQVQIGSTNLFYLDPDKGRVKMDKEDDGTWDVSGDKLSEKELLTRIENEPERFSPNVFLRPVLQDLLLPTVSYVAGPGELAYYAQMKAIYDEFNLDMPAITPRLSLTLLESTTARNLEKLPFELNEYSKRIEDLESEYISQADTPDPEHIFGPWMKKIQEVSADPVQRIGEIDPTLEPAAEKVVAGISNEMNKLKGKVYRAIKQQEETQLNRISRVRSQVFPDGLQERSVSPVFFMNKYGSDFPSQLLERFKDETLNLRVHHVLEL